jgi:hypothetical protein
MIKNVLQEIGGIGLYGVISICLFFTVFTGAFVWACLQRKPFLSAMSALPLQDDSTPNSKGNHE